MKALSQDLPLFQFCTFQKILLESVLIEVLTCTLDFICMFLYRFMKMNRNLNQTSCKACASFFDPLNVGKNIH